MRTVECPNCGAPATNFQNCNFCGSLFVRFASMGLNQSANNYLKNRSILPGLLNHLQKNLELQEHHKENKTVCVGTDIWMDNALYAGGKFAICFVTAASRLDFRDGNNRLIPAFPKVEDAISIATNFTFQIYRDPSLDPKAIDEFNRFKDLPSYSLFTSHVSSETDGYGNEYTSYQFAIDFGQDAEGAAILISEVAHNVYGCDLDKTLEYYTDNMYGLEKIRNAIHGRNDSTDVVESYLGESDWKKWIWIGIAIVGGLIYLLSL